MKTTPAPLNSTKAAISKLAEELSIRLDVSKRTLEDIVVSLGGKIKYSDLMSESEDTLSVTKKGDFEITLSCSASQERNRFTISHEIGHYVLHYIIRNKGEGDLHATRQGSDRCEWEANWFAGAFLMPESTFTVAAKELDSNADLLAIKFNVSKSAAEVRLKSLGLK